MLIFDDQLFSDYAELFLEPVCFDRTGQFGHADQVKALQTIPTGRDLDFETLCHQRARELIDRNQIINLLWSGGADSSLVLAMLDAEDIPSDQLNLVISSDVFWINPNGVKTALKKFTYVLPSRQPQRLGAFMFEDDLMLSGIGLDMLIHDYDIRKFRPDNLNHFIDKLSSESGRQRKEYDDIAIAMAEIVGVDCETAEDFSRLKCFVFFWQQEVLMLGRLAGSGIYGKDFENFFTTEDFQSWSLFHTAKSLSGFDEFGNKRIPSELIKKLNPDYLTTRRSRQQFGMQSLFEWKPVTRITDDWQYTYAS